MTTHYAVVKNGVVENMVVWDGQTNYSVEGSELVEATSDARIGGSWDGNVFVEPEDTRTYAEKRKAEYPPLNELIVSLFEAVVEERLASSIDVQARRVAVKNKYPKDA
tara:strand:- start:56 stop:379 length:324 start_codon:yes stop_codon:yes gene_type:complete